MGDAAGEALTGIIYIDNPFDTEHTAIHGAAGGRNNAAGTFKTWVFSGKRKDPAAINYIEFLASSGNLSVFNYTLYGLKGA